MAVHFLKWASPCSCKHCGKPTWVPPIAEFNIYHRKRAWALTLPAVPSQLSCSKASCETPCLSLFSSWWGASFPLCRAGMKLLLLILLPCDVKLEVINMLSIYTAVVVLGPITAFDEDTCVWEMAVQTSGERPWWCMCRWIFHSLNKTCHCTDITWEAGCYRSIFQKLNLPMCTVFIFPGFLNANSLFQEHRPFVLLRYLEIWINDVVLAEKSMLHVCLWLWLFFLV